MAKTKEELNELKNEFEALKTELKELSKEELKCVIGGAVLLMQSNLNINRLPAEFQEVEYIESFGSQYIKSGIPGNEKLITKIKFAPKSSGYLFGTTDGQSNDYYGLNLYSGKTWECYLGTGYYPKVSSWKNDEIYEFELNASEKTFIVNGKQITKLSNPVKFSRQKEMYFFGLNYANSFNGSKMKIYYIIMEIENEIQHYFVPCVRKEDGMVGMYDLNGSICPLTDSPFFINAGTGSFEAGPKVN